MDVTARHKVLIGWLPSLMIVKCIKKEFGSNNTPTIQPLIYFP